MDESVLNYTIRTSRWAPRGDMFAIGSPSGVEIRRQRFWRVSISCLGAPGGVCFQGA